MTELETIGRDIGGQKVRVTQLAVARQTRLLAKLTKLASPALPVLIGIRGMEDVAMIGRALAALFDGLDDSTVMAHQLALLQSTSVIVSDATGEHIVELNSERNLDAAFGADIEALWQTLAFACEVILPGPLARIKMVVAALGTPPKVEPVKVAA